MPTKPQQSEDVITRILEVSGGGQSLENYLLTLAVECFSPLQLRAAVIVGLESDLEIKILTSFGLSKGELSRFGKLHLLTDSVFSECISGRTFQVPPTQAGPTPFSTMGYGLFLAIQRAGMPFAALILICQQDPELERYTQFWEMVSTATGLAISCQWKPQELPSVALADVDKLTQRQIAILLLVAQKKTNLQIARQLSFGQSTVGHELMRIFEILRVRSRDAAVSEAGRLGLLGNPAQLKTGVEGSASQ
jgi:DNA-binding CsgD family transcriptional regulator